eukprot:8486970-Lingulodinium_polyedra.AAC.1
MAVLLNVNLNFSGGGGKTSRRASWLRATRGKNGPIAVANDTLSHNALQPVVNKTCGNWERETHYARQETAHQWPRPANLWPKLANRWPANGQSLAIDRINRWTSPAGQPLR